MRARAFAGAVLLAGCAPAAPHPDPVETRAFRAAPANRGSESYSAWFADSDGRVVYFGLSPFWELWWQTGGDALADLREPGDHLIGRFELDAARFLEPLRVRAAGPDSRSSVWDVLVHSNGRVYYTTFFEELGWVDPASGATGWVEGLGLGLNELAEGPGGRLYVTRYADAPRGAAGTASGSLLVLTPEGALVRETRLDAAPAVTAPKSVAVDPASGETWLTADVFAPDGSTGHAALRLDADGRVLERTVGGAELLFVRFDALGRGWFVEDRDGRLRLRVVQGGAPLGALDLGPRPPLDTAQDIHFARDGTAVVAFWSGRVELVRAAPGGLEHRTLRLARPRECAPPRGRSVVYSAFLHGAAVYATLFCGPTVLRARLGGS